MISFKNFFIKYNKPAIISDLKSGKILDINEKCLSLFNKPGKDFINLRRSDIFPQKAIIDINKQLKNAEQTASVNSFILNNEGKKINVEINSGLIISENNQYLFEILSLKEKEIYTDVNEKLTKAERLIKENEIKYRALFESADYAIFLFKDDVIAEFNSGAIKMFAGKKEYLLGKNIHELSPEYQPGGRSAEQIAERKDRALNGEPQFFEWQYKKFDNSLFDAEVNLSSVQLVDETFIQAIVRDISKRKQVEYELRQSEAKFRSLVEESLVGVYIIQDGKFPYVNPRAAEIFGYSVNEVISRESIYDFVYEEDRDKVKNNISKRLSGGVTTLHYFFRGVKKDNSVIQVEVMGSYTLFNGKPAVIGTLLDVTGKKKYEKDIIKLSRAVEQSPASIIITDTNGIIEYVNSKFCEVTGYEPEEVVGKNPRILKYGDTPQSFYKDLWNTIKAGDEWRGEFLNKKKNGELFWEMVSISPIKDQEGKIINFLAVKENITKRKHSEEELKIAKEKAEEMNRIKSVFLANMSHELRTPMVAILGYSEILKNEILNPDLKDMAKEIYDSSHRFINTLNLLLDLSKIEANKEIMNYTELDIASIAAEEFEFFRHLAERKGIDFKIILPNEPIISLTDERMLRQIISSVTSNAIKFTNRGGISFKISKESEGYGKEFVILKIIDSGIGIPKNNQNTIFEAFRQISEGLNRTFEGVGLGLTVTKKFVEMMQGTIDVDSEFGKGSTFTIKFPIIRRFDLEQVYKDPSQMQIEFPVNNSENEIPRLLLVEDDKSNAGVIKFFLERIYNVDIALTGEEGVEAAGRKKYSAVLMDIDLGSGMSGLTAAKKIKKIPGYENIPVIAVTALAMRGDKEKFLAEGCTHYISKPFKKDELINLIKEAVDESKELS